MVAADPSFRPPRSPRQPSLPPPTYKEFKEWALAHDHTPATLAPYITDGNPLKRAVGLLFGLAGTHWDAEPLYIPALCDLYHGITKDETPEPSEDHAVTIGDFRALAHERGWSEAYLVEQCKREIDNPREVIREILSGKGLTKPRFTNYDQPERLVDICNTALVWKPLLRLYNEREPLCKCGCKQPLLGRQQYATSACQRRDHRRRK
jgi:hypothetical protein